MFYLRIFANRLDERITTSSTANQNIKSQIKHTKYLGIQKFQLFFIKNTQKWLL